MELLRCLSVLFLSVLYLSIFAESHVVNPLVLLVSFGGFRWDYLDMVKAVGKHTPTFDRFKQEGVIATNGIKNVFINDAFPNHYSIVTGMYEVNHGVVANSFYDPVRGVLYDVHNDTVRLDPYYWNNGTQPTAMPMWPGEPIWITNQRGSTPLLHRNSGVMMWPGCDVHVHGQYPSRYQSYNKDMSSKAKIDQVVNWFTDSFAPINLGLLYFDEPDACGHSFGPDSLEMIDQIVSLDGVLKYLMDKLSEHGLLDHVNVIVTSDHGMAKAESIIYLEDYVDSSLYLNIPGAPVAHIWPQKGRESEVYKKLDEVANLTAYQKKDIPAHYHYTFNTRVPPILIVAYKGHTICRTRKDCKSEAGDHGYSNSLPDMHPIFLAHGPAFRQNYASRQFNNVDIYPLVCHILGINPAAHDGSLENVKHMLGAVGHDEEEEGDEGFFTVTMLTYLLVTGMVALFAGIFCVAAFRTSRIHTRRLRMRVAIPLNGIGRPRKREEGETRLLTSDEEEIP